MQPTSEADYRKHLRAKTLRVVFGLYALVVCIFGWQYLRAQVLAKDYRVISARVTGSGVGAANEARGDVFYQYTVNGHNYSGSFESNPKELGSEVKVNYSPSHPSLSSVEDPVVEAERTRFNIVTVSFCYAFLAALALAVVSKLSPEKGTPAAPDVGFSRQG